MEVGPGSSSPPSGDVERERPGRVRHPQDQALRQPAGDPGDGRDRPCPQPLGRGPPCFAVSPLGAKGRRRLARTRRPRCVRRHRRRPRLQRGRLLGAESGHIGLKLYHWAGSDRIARSIASATCWVGRLEIGGVARRHRDEGAGLEAVAALGRPPDRDRQDRRAGLGRESGRASGQRRPVAEETHRDAVRSVAPVDEERQDLAALEDREDLPDVLPVDRPHPHRLALAGQVFE